MGVVIKQGGISSISAYIGVAIGYINTVILMPKFMETDEIGLFRNVVSAAMIFAFIGHFGVPTMIIKFQSIFIKKGYSKEQLYGFAVKIVVISSLFLVSGLLLLKEHLLSFYLEKSEQINDYFLAIVLLTVEIVVFQFLQSLSVVNLQTYKANLIKDIMYKVFNMMVIVLYALDYIGIKGFVYIHLIVYLLLIVTLIASTVRRLHIKYNFQLPDSNLKKEALTFSSFAFIGTFSSGLLLIIDQQLVTRYLAFSATGIYTTSVYIASVIEIPKRFIVEISTPLLSKYFSQQKIDRIDSHYKSTSVNLLLVGAIILVLIYANVNNIYQIMPNGQKFMPGLNVIYIMGFAKLIDMLFSINGAILTMSQHYKLNVLLSLLAGIALIVLNILLIPRYGMNGAAISFLIVVALHNILKFSILKVKLNISPFTWKTGIILLWCSLIYFVVDFIPFMLNPYLDLLVRSSIISLLFVVSIFKLNLSPEFLQLINQARAKMNRRK